VRRQTGKILIVDDNLTNRAVIEEALGDRYELKSAGSGEEALALLSEFRPDIVLLDIMMPGMDGYETCRRLRANLGSSYTKVIMLSAKTSVAERLAGYEAGADDYMTKPFNAQELLAKVRVYLRLKSVEELDQLKSNLLRLLNHETRTPLNGIIPPLEFLMAGEPLDEETRARCLELASASAKRLQKLFENSLRLCALKADQWDFVFSRTDFSNVVKQAVTSMAPLAAQKQVSIDCELNPALAEVDAGEMLSVVTALLENAIRFSSPGGRVWLKLSTEADLLAVHVKDLGEGIAPQFLDRIFDEFNEIDVTHHTEGQRLSLSIARLIVAAHSGTIHVESEKGAGTTFTLRLPLVDR